MTLTNPLPPAPASGFRWAPASWGVVLVADGLEGFRHGWTPRQVQLRGSPRVEAEGWSQVASALGVEPEGLVRLRQVHGGHVHLADAHVPTSAPPEADAAVSGERSRGLIVQVADCVPLLLADRSSGRVAVAHAGWRGTAAGVSQAALAALVDTGSVGSVVAAIGPSSFGPTK
jgi:copper oxidase (laccase) domain-containing protein